MARTALLAVVWIPSAFAQTNDEARQLYQLSLSNPRWTGDLDAMLERRLIRVLVPYSRTLFFNERGHERGITADVVRELEHYLNGKYAAQLGKRPVTKWGGFDARIATFERRIRQITNNTRTEERRRFESTIGLFDKYGKRYGFDPLMLTAQGFQESRLRQEARSPVGAIGVMQVVPATGAEMRTGDITVIEPNIHAGTKYMSHLMTRFFTDASFDVANRPLFAFASYNAGPGAISRHRREAARRGLDPDQWFNHVEVVVAEKLGIETTTYVRNIYKYYVAYRLLLAAQDAQRAAREKASQSESSSNK